MHINTARRRFTGIDDYAHTHTQTQTHTHTHTRARAHAHTHTHTYTHTHTHIHTHTHTHTCEHTNTIQTVGAKDSITQLKCSEKRNVMSLFLKEGRVVECLMSRGRLFQM